jgi:hypothetical protein
MSDSAQAKEKMPPPKPKTMVKSQWCLSKCGQGNSLEAKRLATVILEVLAGMRTPGQAAQALGMSVMRYYQVEARAVQGLVSACEAPRRGPGKSSEKELHALRRQHERLQRELSRQQALARLTQRSLGLAAPPAPAKGKPGTKKRRRPVVRSLRMAQQLRQAAGPEAPAVVEMPSPAKPSS